MGPSRFAVALRDASLVEPRVRQEAARILFNFAYLPFPAAWPVYRARLRSVRAVLADGPHGSASGWVRASGEQNVCSNSNGVGRGCQVGGRLVTCHPSASQDG